MEKRTSASRKTANIFLSVVLMLGLLPVPAFALPAVDANTAPLVAAAADEPAATTQSPETGSVAEAAEAPAVPAVDPAPATLEAPAAPATPDALTPPSPLSCCRH